MTEKKLHLNRFIIILKGFYLTHTLNDNSRTTHS